ncbi:hypothetical protein GQ600_19188 [Phytophthora cactorum]|nr:hypothetical protein GQ600_19188 [Phytophthora cactorum]
MQHADLAQIIPRSEKFLAKDLAGINLFKPRTRVFDPRTQNKQVSRWNADAEPVCQHQRLQLVHARAQGIDRVTVSR